MKISANKVDGFLDKAASDLRAVLIYGPDSGLVRERAMRLLRLVVEDPADPFRVVEFTAATLRNDPARLSDETAAMSLVGGRRVIRLRETGDAAAPALQEALKSGEGDALIIVEAGNLAARSRLRSLFEKLDSAAALPCYSDEGMALQSVVRETLSAHSISIDRDAVEYLCQNLGSDRLVSRSELEKLSLYVGDGGAATLADAVACVGDSAALALEDIAFATAGGDPAALNRALSRAYHEGAQPVSVIRIVSRHFQRLHLAAGVVADGASTDAALKSLRPPVFFKRADAFRKQLRRWNRTRLASALVALSEAEVQCKSTGLPAQAICGQALLRLTAVASVAARA